MGGQMEYFGLWLSADFGKGHSKAKPTCTTYSSPQLSAKEEFEIKLLELWGVGDPVIPEATVSVALIIKIIIRIIIFKITVATRSHC